MNEELAAAIEAAKKLDKGVYLMFIKKGTASREVLWRLQEVADREGIKFYIVQTFYPPEECVQLYKVKPEEPL